MDRRGVRSCLLFIDRRSLCIDFQQRLYMRTHNKYNLRVNYRVVQNRQPKNVLVCINYYQREYYQKLFWENGKNNFNIAVPILVFLRVPESPNDWTRSRVILGRVLFHDHVTTVSGINHSASFETYTVYVSFSRLSFWSLSPWHKWGLMTKREAHDVGCIQKSKT